MIIVEIIKTEAWEEIFNAPSQEHPTKEEHYTRKASENELPLPEFDHDQPSKGKMIESVNLEEKLDYSFEKGI